MAYIASEIPSGLINGLNTAFNTSQTGTSIISVFKDGAEITAANYTYVGTLLTFTTAPLFSVSIIYIVGTGFALSDGEILVPNSPLTGTINGVNKNFTVSNGGIKQVLSAVYDGAETRDFSFVPGSSTITFVNAPVAPLSPIYIDYITYGSAADTNFVGNSSQAEILDRLYNDILHEKTTSSVFRLSTSKAMINEIQDAICKGGYADINGFNYKSPNLTFLNKRSFYKIYPDTTVTTDVSPGATSIPCSNTYPTTGTLLINGNIVSYNGNDGTTITGVIGLNTYLTTSDTVRLVYGLTTDLYKNFSVKIHSSGSEVILKEIDSRDNLTEAGNSNLGYFITEDYYNNKYIGFVGFYGYSGSVGNNVERVEMNYIRVAPNITETVNSIIPGTYALTIIPNLVASRRLMVGGEANSAKNLEVLGVNELKRLYENYAAKTKEFRGVIETSTSNFLPNY